MLFCIFSLKLISESDGFVSCLHGISKICSSLRPLPLSVESMGKAQYDICEIIKTLKAIYTNQSEEVVRRFEDLSVQQHIDKISTSDPSTLATEFSGQDIQYPFLSVVGGSIFLANIVSSIFIRNFRKGSEDAKTRPNAICLTSRDSHSQNDMALNFDL